LFDALVEGDGSWSEKTTPGFNGYYSTTSSQLADDVQEIAMKLGYRAQKHQHRHKKAPYHHDLYRVMMTQTEEAGFYHANVQSVPYDGIVWCVDVPPHHLFVTRRNGKIGIHGNSTSQTEDVQDWDSIKPVAGTVKDYLDRRLLWKTLGFTTLEFEWQIKDTDELRQAQILELQWNMDAVTVDELREIYEHEPLPNGLGQLTKTPFTAVIQQQTTTPDVGALGGPPQLDADGRWRTPTRSCRSRWRTSARATIWSTCCSGRGACWSEKRRVSKRHGGIKRRRAKGDRWRTTSR